MKGDKPMKKILVSVFISLCIILGVYFPVSAENPQDSVVDLSSIVGESMEYVSVDFSGNNLLLLSYKSQQEKITYYLSIYDTKTQNIKQKKLNDKNCTLDVFYGAKFQSKDQILIYGADYKKDGSFVHKGILYNNSLKKIKKIKYTQPEFEDLAKKSSLITTRFSYEEEYAVNYDFDNIYQYLVFYDDPQSIYIEKDSKNFCQTNYKKKMLTSKYTSTDQEESLTLSVKDYQKSVCVNQITILPKQQKSMLNLQKSCINNQYACLILEEYTEGESTITTPYLWNYAKTPTNTGLTVEKLTKSGVDKKNKTLIQNIKKKYDINIYNKKLQSDVGNGEKCKKASSVSLCMVLSTMENALSLFPNGFFTEICQGSSIYKSCDIYVVEEIPGDVSGYVRYSDLAMVLDASSFTNSILVHEFMHQMDIRISDYYEKQNKYFLDLWDRLNPKDFYYTTTEDREFNQSYFVSSYAMTTSNEDRADLFMYLFYSDEYYNSWTKYPNVAKKAKFLCDSIRKAFPSVQAVKQTVWEKNAPKVVLDQGKITDLTKTSKGIKIQWKKVSNAGGYYIYRQTNGKGGYKKIATIDKGSTLTYTDKKVKNGSKYQYKIKAFKGKVKGSNSAVEMTYYLTQPTISSIKKTSKGIFVQWEQNKKVTGYEIRYRSGSEKYTTLIINNKDTVKWTITKLSKNKSYQISVRTYKKVNGTKYISAWSKTEKI
jgi:hypothetical protein